MRAIPTALKTGSPLALTYLIKAQTTEKPDSNAVIPKDQTIDLPCGQYNRIYFLAALVNGDQRAVVENGGRHHHDRSGKNIDYSYFYLCGYVIDLVAGVTTFQLPDNENIGILAISAAEKSSRDASSPIYDVLPASSYGEVSHAY